MYTILLNANKQLIATHREAIIEKSNLVDKIRFLIPETIGDNVMSDFNAVHVEYKTPISQTYYNECLTMDTEMYDETHYQYIVPVDTHLTEEPGEIEIQLSFYRVEMTADGQAVQGMVFKTTSCTIQVIPVENWQQFIPDKSLMGLDQRILKQLTIEEEIKARQEEIEHTLSNIIDDENVSDHTTYSSKKIEEKFIDEDEVDEELEEREIDNESIDTLFPDSPEPPTPTPSDEISEDDIDTLFPDEVQTSSESTSDNTNIDINNEISNAEIDSLF